MNPKPQISINHTEEGELIEDRALIKVDPIVLPAVNVEQALAAWNAYEELKSKVLKDEDFTSISTKKGTKKYPNKSAWRKLASFFNLSVEMVTEKETKNEDGTIDFDVTYRATAPNGRSAIGDGSFNSMEKTKGGYSERNDTRHNTRANAHTRAFNRAVSNLIGGGEVSADEFSESLGEDQGQGASHGSAHSSAASGLNKYDPNWEITFGKYSKPTRKKIGDIPFEDLEEYCVWLVKDAADKKNPLKGGALDLVRMTELRAQYEVARDPSEPPGVTDEDLNNLQF